MIKEKDADRAQAARLARERELAPETRVFNLVLTVLFCLLIAGAAVLHFAMPDRAKSEKENRSLESLPKFSFESLASGEFTDKFSKYLSDQFPARDALVTVKSAAEIALGRQENGGVIVNGDYLAARNDYPSRENLTENVSAVSAFTKALEGDGVPVLFAPAGRVCDVYDSRLPSLYGSAAQDSLWNELDTLGDGTVYVPLRDALRAEARTNDYLYYRTDHHWTTEGAYLAYTVLWDALPEDVTEGLTMRGKDFFKLETVTTEFYGTAVSSSGAWWITPDEISLCRFVGDDTLTVTVADNGEVHEGMYYREFLDVKDKYSVFLGENAGRLDITSGTERPRIVMIKDSFAQSIAPFFAADFDVTLIDPRYYKKPIYETVKDEAPDAVIVLMNADTLTSDTVLRPLRRGLTK